VPGVTPAVLSALGRDFYLSSFAVQKAEIVGPKVGGDLRRQALYVTLAGLGAMLIYIWYRFELVYGVAAVIATFHDVLITLGIFSLLNKEITLTVIAALLTLVGYSMNDTIVVFDRIRENVRLNKRENFLGLVNRSINQTLSRTILTSGLTFLAVLSLYLFGRGHPRICFGAGGGSDCGHLFLDCHRQSGPGFVAPAAGGRAAGGKGPSLRTGSGRGPQVGGSGQRAWRDDPQTCCRRLQPCLTTACWIPHPPTLLSSAPSSGLSRWS
jgi:hypothetical protein